MMNDDNPLVSIVIIAHNEHRNIARALKSLEQQSFNRIEIVVIDDGSTDDTASIVKRHASADSRIKLHRLESNHGMQLARIIGTQRASCHLVAFLDADDTLDQGAIQALYDTHIATNADIVEMASRHSIARLPVGFDMHIPSTHLKKSIYSRDEMIDLLLSGHISANVWTKLYRKQVIDNAQLQPSGIILGEDLLFNLNVMQHASSIAWTDYRGANYNSGDANLSRLYKWHEQKILCSCLLNMPMIANSDKRKSIVAQNMVEDFTENIALQFYNPFSSRRKIEQWINHELSLDFWNEIRPLLDNEHFNIISNSSLAKDAAKQKLRQNRKNYTIFQILNLLSRL